VVVRADTHGDGDGDEVVVDVIDHGDGIAPEAMANLFDRFFRADDSRARATGGAGLGLAIVASIAEAHQGRCTVHDTPGGGATFRFALPAAAPAPAPAPAAAQDEAATTGPPEPPPAEPVDDVAPADDVPEPTRP
jgi:two-component system OmpR family sensor kinase